MRLLSRLEAKQKFGAIWYLLFRQSPESFVMLGLENIVR